MAIIKIKLTSDILTLITNIHFKELPDLRSEKYPLTWGIDLYSLYGGSFVLEDMAHILGKYDQVIPESIEDPLGPRFPKELEDYLWETHEYIVENLEFIEDLVHYYSNKGGLSEGTYKCHREAKDWVKLEN
jgi:hypothetical protein